MDIKRQEENIELNFPVEYSDALNKRMKSSFWKCNDDSHINSALHYYLIIPKNIKPTSLIEKNIRGLDSLKEIASYRRIDTQPYMEVQLLCEKIKHEINVSDWLEHLLEIAGEQAIKKRTIKGNTGTYLDVLTSKEFPNGETVIYRTTAQKNYDQSTKTGIMVSLKVSCLLKDYKILSEDMMAIATSWNFINLAYYQLSEDLKIFNQPEVDLNFYYPMSWKLGKLDSTETIPLRFVIFNKDENGKVKGGINIFITDSKTNENTFSKEILSRFIDNNVTIENPTLKEVIGSEKSDYLIKQWELSSFIGEKNDGRINLLIGETKKELFAVEMVGEMGKNNYYDTARNKRAFELILQTLRTSEQPSAFSVKNEDKNIGKKKKSFLNFFK